MTAAPYSWVNASSFQIFCAGMDATYTKPTDFNPTTLVGPLQFPSGGNYAAGGNTFDDITNFSSGTLEDNIP